MTIQTQFGDGTKDELIYSTIYRNVIKNVNLMSYIEGFYAQREQYRWGKLYQLKGKEKILLRTFGKYPNGETVTF